MGLTGFYKLLKKHGYDPAPVELHQLRGKTVALDGDFVLYQSLLGHTTGEATAVDVAAPVSKWLTLAKQADIHTIFVTSGGPAPIEKTHCSNVRKRKRERQQERITELEATLPALAKNEDLGEELDVREKICRMQNNIRRITSTMSTQVVDILRADGHTCRQAKSEADFMLVMLSEDGKCDFVATDDADIIVAGAKHVLRNFTKMLTDSTTRGMDYCRKSILAGLKLNSDAFLQLGAILSCDYQPALCNVGPVTALRMMRQFGSVDNFLRSEVFTVETKSKKRKYSLPAGMTVENYISTSERSVEIFRSRPDAL
jgi:flap endonuclease-1